MAPVQNNFELPRQGIVYLSLAFLMRSNRCLEFAWVTAEEPGMCGNIERLAIGNPIVWR